MSIENKNLLSLYFHPALTHPWLEKQKEPSPQEKKEIEFVLPLINQRSSPITEIYRDYQRRKGERKKNEGGQERETEPSVKRILERLRSFTQEGKVIEEENKEALIELAWLIRQFQDLKKKENNDFFLFNEQILALIRLVNHYQKTRGLKNGGGLIEELKTGEGKTSVIIPVFLAWLGLREDNIHIHEINPYLLQEGYQQFLRFAQHLGIEDQVGIFNLQRSKESQGKRFLFGYWSDFVHWYQFSFLQKKGFPPFPKNPFLVLDEVDQLLQDESVTPAVISRPQETETFLFSYLEKWRKELIEIDRPSFHFQYRDKNGKEISLLVNPKDYDSEINSIKGLINQVVQFYEFLKAHDSLVRSELENQGLLSDNNNKKEWWIKEFDRRVLEFLVTAKLKGTQNEDLINDPNFLKKLREAIDNQNFLPWWSDSEFQQALINAFFMEREKDYIVKEGLFLLMEEGDPFNISIGKKQEIKPLALSTGYSERGKQFNDLVQLFLVIKEQWEKGVEPEKIVLPETITTQVDRFGVADFYQKFNRIYGFTGTASSVARRLLEGYNLETTVIRQHFLTNRTEKPPIFVKDFTEMTNLIKQVFDNKEDQRNVLIVVNSPEEAQLIQEGINSEDLEIKILSASNENEDRTLYQWISDQEGKRRVLITVKMVGRGVDLQPTEKIKNQGFLLISTTPLSNERAYQQLIGRVGRRGEKGEIVLMIHPNDPLFSNLSPSEQKKLTQLFKEPQKHQNEIWQLVEEAWGRNEEMITERLKGRRIYNHVVNYLRRWLENSEFHFDFIDENDKDLEEEFRNYIRDSEQWIGLIWHLENTFLTWAAAGPLGPFGQGDPEGIFADYFFKLMRNEIYPEFLKSRKKAN